MNAPIAIVGMSCRFPGGAVSLDQFWKNLTAGVDGITQVPSDRWDAASYSSRVDSAGKTSVQRGGFLQHDIFQFDPAFFGISPKEAAPMDIQQRLLLETCWEAFEDAGWVEDSVKGAEIGVFIGSFFLDNKVAQFSPLARALLSSSTATSATATMLANRLSHVFDLRGPSMSVDTACSASLVALHLACQALWAEDCTAAVVGGVNIMLRPETTTVMHKGGFLSEQARCATFSADASGYVRGEGAGVVVLKPLAQALQDGDRVYACIRATGVNQDGRTPQGIAYPNGAAQQTLLERVVRRGGLTPADIDFVEAHGTGTQAGDITETHALQQVLGSAGRATQVPVGALKSQIGHLEGAAGVASVIKTALSLYHGALAPNLHSYPRNPSIPFDDMILHVPTTVERLPNRVCRALVNGFGYGGTNACALLEGASPSPTGGRPFVNAAESKLMLLPLSGKSPAALNASAQNLLEFIEGNPHVAIEDVAYTYQIRRSHFSHRMAVLGEGRAELVERLRASLDGASLPGVRRGRVATGSKLAFVFTGMGPQRPQMGMELYARYQPFREYLEQCDQAIFAIAKWSVIEELQRPGAESRISQTAIAQVANFALQVSLVALYRDFGVEPVGCLGHSVGEVAAAHCAGALDLDQAALVSVTRGRLQSTVAGGGMLAAGCSVDRFHRQFGGIAGVEVAAINAAESITLSGERGALEGLAKDLTALGVFARMLQVEVAYHSAQMNPLEGPLKDCLGCLTPRAGKHALYSSVTGGLLSGESWDGSYWWSNVRQAVDFHAALLALVRDGYSQILEVGPHPVLANSIRQTVPDTVSSHASLERSGDKRAFEDSLASLYVGGVSMAWQALGSRGGKLVHVPSYPWQRSRHWAESELSLQDRLGTPGPAYLKQTVYGPGLAWRVDLASMAFDWIRDHRLGGDAIVFPGAGYVAAVVEANQRVHARETCHIGSIDFLRLLVVAEKEIHYLETRYSETSGKVEFWSSVAAGKPTDWTLHAAAELNEGTVAAPTERFTPSGVGRELEASQFYGGLASKGLHYGHRFQTVERLWLASNALSVELNSPTVSPDVIDPTLLDGAFQSVNAWLDANGVEGAFLPTRIEHLTVFAPIRGRCFCRADGISHNAETLACRLTFYSLDGTLLAAARSTTFKRVTFDGTAQPESEVGYYAVGWAETSNIDSSVATGRTPKEVLIIGRHGSDLVRKLQTGCLQEGIGVTLVPDIESVAIVAGHASVILDCTSAAGNSDRMAPEELAGRAYRLVNFLQRLTTGTPNVTYRLIASSTTPLMTALTRLLRVAEVEIGDGLSVSTHVLEGAAKEIVARSLLGLGRGDYLHQDGVVWHQKLSPVTRKVSPRQARGAAPHERAVLTASDATSRQLSYEVAEPCALQADEVLIRVHAAGINFKDLLKVHRRLSPQVLDNTYLGATLGMEASGVVEQVGSNVTSVRIGDAVVCIAPSALASHVIVRELYVVPKPSSLSWAQAANMMAYMTAFQALEALAKLQPGECVLVTSAAGGVGLAAVAIAQRIGAVIFATAGTESRRQHLKDLGVQHVFSSRDRRFVDDVLDATDGRGVDVVLNAAPGVTLRQCFRLLSHGGRFVEIGKGDISIDAGLPMGPFNRNVAFFGLDIDLLLSHRPTVTHALMKQVVQAFEQRDLPAMPTTVFAAADVADAFSLIERNKHIGKVIVNFESERVPVRDQWRLNESSTYLVVGGTQGLGLATATFLAEQGARRVVVASRSGKVEPQALAEFSKRFSAELVVRAADVTDIAQVQKLIEECRAMGHRLGGVVNAATAYCDQLLPNLTPGAIEAAIAPKVAGTANLIEALRGTSIDFLLVYSSISALIGNRGQASYVCANGFVEGLARAAQDAGLPFQVVSWGAVGEVGFVERQSLEDHFRKQGIGMLSLPDCSRALRYVLETGARQLLVSRINWKTFLSANSTIRSLPMFAEMREGQDDAGDLLRAKFRALSAPEREALVSGELRADVAELTRANATDIDVHTRINDLGVDSLLASELNGRIQSRFGVNVSTVELLSGPTVNELVGAVLRKVLPLESTQTN